MAGAQTRLHAALGGESIGRPSYTVDPSVEPLPSVARRTMTERAEIKQAWDARLR